MRVVVMIRHPAAFAVSIRRRNWRHRFGDFLDQPLLMRDFLAPHEAELRAAADRRPDILDEAILLWNVLYSAVATLQERHPDWIYVRHEDVAASPVERYRELYADLGLEWTAPVERLVQETSSASNPGEARRADSIRRASASQVRAWTSQLSPEETERVRSGTDPLWRATTPTATGSRAARAGRGWRPRPGCGPAGRARSGSAGAPARTPRAGRRRGRRARGRRRSRRAGAQGPARGPADDPVDQGRPPEVRVDGHPRDHARTG